MVSTSSKITSTEVQPENPPMVSSSRTSPCPTLAVLLRRKPKITIFFVEMIVAQISPSTTFTSLEEPTALAMLSPLVASNVSKFCVEHVDHQTHRAVQSIVKASPPANTIDEKSVLRSRVLLCPRHDISPILYWS